MTKARMLFTTLALAALCLAAGPATRPAAATKPAVPTPVDLAPLEAKAAEAEAAVGKAKADARARWESSDDYKRLRAQVDRAKAALDKARAGNDVRAKLDASKAYNDTRAFLAKVEADELKDAGRVEAEAAAKAREDLLAAAQRNREIEAASPIGQAIRAGKVIRGMTRAQVERIFGKPATTTDDPRGTTCVYQAKGPKRYSNDDPGIRAVAVDPGLTALGPSASPPPPPLEVKREVVVVYRDDQVVDFRDTRLRD